MNELAKAGNLPVQPSGEEVQLAEVVSPPVETKVAAAKMRAKLPETASRLPLIGRCGLMAFRGAFALRAARSSLV